jgi:HEAT repeat protein
VKKRLRILFTIPLIGLLGGLAWQIFRPDNQLFQGKTQSEWIKSITYFGDEAQLKKWRDLGPEGLNLLARALDRGRFYRKSYRWIMPRLPGALNYRLYRRLPNPADAHPTRMCVISLLSQLGKDAKPVEPAIARALNDDDEGVRLGALGCYEVLLDVMGEKEKTARLPAFLLALQDGDAGIRNNAAVALWHYPGQAREVVPALVKALRDPVVAVRLLSAKALAHIDLPAAIKAGVVPIAIDILKDPNDQVAYQAAELLGDMETDPALAVPALAESVQGTNALVAATAARALGRLRDQARSSIPALRKALEHEHSGVRREAMNALKQIDPSTTTTNEAR